MSLQASSIHACSSTRPVSLAARLPFFVRLVLLFAAWVSAGQSVNAQEMWTILPTITDFKNTEAKPQSKVWFHGHTFWTVLAGAAGPHTGTWLLRLEPDNTWAYVQQISTNTGTMADVKVVGNVIHVLMHNSSARLVSFEYDAGTKTYLPWTERPTETPVAIGETGTIDIDSTGRMWLATDSTVIDVYYSDYPYSSFVGPIVIANDVNSDDISAVAALPNNTIGIFWSNQATQRFGFKYHVDGTDPMVWSSDEAPGAAGAVVDGIGLAEDHINLAVAADGTLFAAIKTGYSAPALPTTGLFVRRPDAVGTGGTWEDLHYVDTVGTRPVVVVNDELQTVRVFYTSTGGVVYFRESPTSAINFGPIEEVMSGGFNDLTSLKDAWMGRLLFLTSNVSGTTGVVMQPDPGLIGHFKMDEGSGNRLLDVSGYGNDADIVGNPAWTPGAKNLALDLDGSTHAVVSDQAALDVTTALTISAWIQPVNQVNQAIVSRATGAIDGYTLGLSSSTATAPGTVFFGFNQATSGELYQLNSISQYPVGGYSWMHVAATYDGTMMRMFINGVEETSMPGPAAIAANAVNLGIGAHGDGSLIFQGVIDDVKMFSRALSAEEIGTLMGSGPPQADLAITKDNFVTKVNLADPITYVIEASNLGPEAVVGAKVTDLMPGQLANVTWTCSATVGASCGAASGTGSIIDFVNLPAGGKVTYTVHATLSNDASGEFMTNTATIRASHISDPVPGNNSASDTDELPFIIEAHFDEGNDGFTYVDDLFIDDEDPQPLYADGAYAAAGGFNGGGLRVDLGFVNGSNTAEISGGFQRTFNLLSAGPATLSFRYNATITARSDRFVRVQASLDGVLQGVAPDSYIVRLFGISRSTPATTGWQLVTIELGNLAAGTHTLSLGGFLNRKSDSSEGAVILIDDVRVISGAAPGPGDVPVPPSIVTPPVSMTVTEPAAAAFSVVVSGDAPFTYQWRRNGAPILGANGTSYVMGTTSMADNGAQFDVVVNNAGGTVTSVAATLTVNPAPVAPSITTEPASLTVMEPATAAFSVVATGDAPLSYQWKKNGIDIGGATSASYVTPPTAMIDNGAQFSVVVTNAVGSATSAVATLTVTPAPVPPSITTQPASTTVIAPANAIFSVVATGDAPLSYQWRHNGVDIPGATGSSVVFGPTELAHSGSTFDVVVTNGAGTATSTAAVLTVNAAPVPPSITTEPASTTVTAPNAATFTVVATGDAPLSYQWRRNGVDIAGATSATYVKTPTAYPTDNGSTYSVVVTNGAGSATSVSAVLTVNPAPVAPSITSNPASVTVTMPAAATFSVTATGTAPLSYQWRRNGIDIAGATGSSYVLDPTAVEDSGSTFDVVVTNAAGSATSSAATLTVLSGVTSVVFEAHFEGGSDGFAYADDAFGTVQPTYADGTIVASGFSGGGAQVMLGGVNGSNTSNMSGGWHRSFALASAAPTSVTFRFNLTGTLLDSKELGRVLVSINGVLVGVSPNSHVAEVGGNGTTMTTGWQQVTLDLGMLPAGNHVLTLGGYLTRKTSKEETAEILIDDVLLTVEQ